MPWQIKGCRKGKYKHGTFLTSTHRKTPFMQCVFLNKDKCVVKVVLDELQSLSLYLSLIRISTNFTTNHTI